MVKAQMRYEEGQAALAGLVLGAPVLTAEAFAAPLLAWYEAHGRTLPWRKKWPELAPAYDVFLSELMLQQTVVATVIPYFERFKSLWPSIEDLANSSEEDLLKEWAGLGYYARARNLRKAAIALVQDHKGQFPKDEAALLKLPGIGPYTAAAIQAFAYDRPAIVLDGNVERVLARYAGLMTPLPALKSHLREVYPQIAPDSQHADFAQAIMDIGARICIPSMPRCDRCPLSASCLMAGRSEAQYLPVKPKKTPKRKRQGIVFVAHYGEKAVMVRRPEKGLLGGMMGFPTIGWATGKAGAKEAADKVADKVADNLGGHGVEDAPFAADWRPLNQGVKHVFTHFELTLTIYHAVLDSPKIDAPYQLVVPEEAGLASVFAKVWQVVSDHLESN